MSAKSVVVCDNCSEAIAKDGVRIEATSFGQQQMQAAGGGIALFQPKVQVSYRSAQKGGYTSIDLCSRECAIAFLFGAAK